MRFAWQTLATIIFIVVLFINPTRSYADWPTPLISVKCLPEMRILTLNVISEWNLCAQDQECKNSEAQGAYPAEVFLQRFSKVPFSCKIDQDRKIEIAVVVYGTDKLGLSEYEFNITYNDILVYKFRHEFEGSVNNLNLILDGNNGSPMMMMACLMKNQSIISVPDSVTCQTSGLGDREVTFNNSK